MCEDENNSVMITSAAGASSSTSSALVEAALAVVAVAPRDEVTPRRIWPRLPRFAGFIVMSAIVGRLVNAGGAAEGTAAEVVAAGAA